MNGNLWRVVTCAVSCLRLQTSRSSEIWSGCLNMRPAAIRHGGNGTSLRRGSVALVAFTILSLAASCGIERLEPSKAVAFKYGRKCEIKLSGITPENKWPIPFDLVPVRLSYRLPGDTGEPTLRFRINSYRSIPKTLGIWVDGNFVLRKNVEYGWDIDDYGMSVAVTSEGTIDLTDDDRDRLIAALDRNGATHELNLNGGTDPNGPVQLISAYRYEFPPEAVDYLHDPPGTCARLFR